MTGSADGPAPNGNGASADTGTVIYNVSMGRPGLESVRFIGLSIVPYQSSQILPVRQLPYTCSVTGTHEPIKSARDIKRSTCKLRWAYWLSDIFVENI